MASLLIHTLRAQLTLDSTGDHGVIWNGDRGVKLLVDRISTGDWRGIADAGKSRSYITSGYTDPASAAAAALTGLLDMVTGPMEVTA